jgi:hypothetical protein
LHSRVTEITTERHLPGLAGIVTVFAENAGWQGWQPAVDVTDKRFLVAC